MPGIPDVIKLLDGMMETTKEQLRATGDEIEPEDEAYTWGYQQALIDIRKHIDAGAWL